MQYIFLTNTFVMYNIYKFLAWVRFADWSSKLSISKREIQLSLGTGSYNRQLSLVL
jgi:hypothetical protein